MLVDEVDLPAIREHHWWITRPSKIAKYAVTKIKGQRVFMHRFIMHANPQQVVDHINRETLDNRRVNLRLTTPGGNNHNSRYRAVPFLGVRLSPSNKAWIARIAFDHRRIIIGQYPNKIEAGLAYDRYADILYGPFGPRNFPNLIDREVAETLIRRSMGRIFSVSFFKRKSPTFRTMLARCGVTKGVSGKGLRFNPATKALISVFDMQKHSYRFINLLTVVQLSMSGKRYRLA